MVFGWKVRLGVLVVMVRCMRGFSMWALEMMGGLERKPAVTVWGLSVRPVRKVIDSGVMMVMRRRMEMVIRSVSGLRKRK